MARVKCPVCNSEFDIANHDEMCVKAFHNESNEVIGTLVPAKKGESKMEEIKLSKEINFKTMSAAEKAEVLKAMGFNPFDVMSEHSITSDEVVEQIFVNGYIKNQKLHRRWITAQTMHLLGWYNGVTKYDSWTDNMNHRYGYYAQFETIRDEMKVLAKLEISDEECFKERVQFFNKDVLVELCYHHAKMLELTANTSDKKRCKGVPYIRMCGQDVFVSDIYKKILSPYYHILWGFEQKKTTYLDNYNFICNFMKLPFFKGVADNYVKPTKKCYAWVDAFKGSGSYFTMQNLVRYSGLKLVKYETSETLNRDDSLKYLEEITRTIPIGERYKLLALLKKSLQISEFNFKKVISK